MIKVRDEKDQVNIAKVYRAGQEHIFRFWDELPPDDRRQLLGQIERLDFQLLARLVQKIGEKAPRRPIEPPRDVLRLPASEAEREQRARARAAGEEALAAGRVACIVVAGGQGTRLGFPGPKGAFPIGPITQKTLFQLFAEKIQATGRRYKTTIPWYVMTSEGNREAVERYFQEHSYLGLGRADTFFFTQRELPAVDKSGKLLLAEKGKIATSPNGHGGVIPALRESGALDDMARRGHDLVFYWQVDNPLARVAHPVFLGHVLLAGAEAGAKVASKRDPHEKVGVFGLLDGKLGVIEYSELSKEDAERRAPPSEADPKGRLVYDAGNLAIHAFTRGFLERLSAAGVSMPYHQALKKVPYVGRKGELVEPEAPNGIKFETFIFDALAEARGCVIMEVDRREEFAPVKNAAGEDSPETSRRALVSLWGGWLERAGAKVARDAAGEVAVPIEISPLAALDEDDVARKVAPGTEIAGPFKL
jgi:UDP-N-acetylglucosamine/UDP-N-acetylgalactosamine diphosphorylase